MPNITIYNTRDDFKNALPGSHVAGNRVIAGGFEYVYVGTSMTLISDLPGWTAVRPSFAHFGGDTTGASDVSSTINQCLAAYKECYIPADNVQHKIIAGVTQAGWIRGTQGKSRLKAAGTGIPIQMSGEWLGDISQRRNFTQGLAPGDKTFTISGSIAGLQVGKWILIHGGNPPIPNLNGARTGEIVQIEKIVGNEITLMQGVAFAYPTGQDRYVTLVNWARNCGVEGVEMEGNVNAWVSGTVPELPMIHFKFCEAPVAQSNELHHHNYTAVKFTACHSHIATNNYIHDLNSADDDVNGGFGYGIEEAAVNLGGIISHNRVERCRNGYTTGAGPAGTANFNFGVPMNTLVSSNTMQSMFQSGISSHEAGYYLNFIGNTINGCRGNGIVIRAVGHVVQGNVISNTVGAGISVVSSPTGDVRDTTVNGNTLMRTNLGVVPQGGENNANLGAINSTGPNPIITNNVILYSGGPAVRVNYVANGMVCGNRAYNPCQLTSVAENRFAFGAVATSGTDGYCIVSGNSLICTDGKTVDMIRKPVGVYFEGGDNVGRGYTGLALVGETAGNYALEGMGVNKVNLGWRITSVQLTTGGVLKLDQGTANINSGILSVSSETGSADTVETIQNGLDGTMLVIRPIGGQTLTIKHGTGSTTDNIRLRGGVNAVLRDATKVVTLIRISGLWVQPQ